jgi:hypothetical protein
MMGFTASGFWIAYFMQSVQMLPTIMVAVHLLPMAVAGLAWNVVAAYILHMVNNTAIMIFGSLCFFAANMLFSFMKESSNYWAFIFPALILNVGGADLNFNVANVSVACQPTCIVTLPRCLGCSPPALLLTLRQMYVMSSLPRHQQSLAGGIFNVVIRLSNTVVMGITTAVFSSVEVTPAGMADPMLKYTRAFQTCLAFSVASVLITPFIRLGTQGNSPSASEPTSDVEKDQIKGESSGPMPEKGGQ